MKKNLAITVGAITCGASLLLSGCGDDATPQSRDDDTGTTGDPALVPGTTPVQTPVTNPGTTPVTTTPTTTTPPTGTPSEGGGTTPPTAMPTTPVAGGGVAVIPDATGWVQGDTNTVGIQGAWYGYNDCSDSPGDCTLNHLPEEGGFDNIDGKMCTSGTTAAVLEEAEFSTKWGAGIALDLNALGGAAAGKSPWDATAMGVTGFTFDIEFNTPGSVRVNLPTPTTDTASHFKEVSVGGSVTVTWADFAQGSWIALPDRVDLDPTSLLSLQFQVPSEMDAAVPFDFCISNLAAVQ